MVSKHERKMGIREASTYTGLPTGTLSYAAKCDPPRLRSYKVSDPNPRVARESIFAGWE